MCNCTSNQNKFTLRSSSQLGATDQALVNFKNSSDYKAYLKNFKTVPQFELTRLLTYNYTTQQAIFIPVIQTNKEKSVLISYFDLVTNKMFTIFIQSKGDLDNLVELSGTVNVYTVSKSVLFNGDFNDSKFIKISPPSPTPTPVGQVGSGCISESVSSITSGASGLICMLFPEECVAAVLLHCMLSL